jgi:rhodanese-related sulfurtransferase
MAGARPHAVLDLRERAAYERGHVFRATSLPRRLLETRLAALVPAPGVPVVLVDEDGRLSALARPTLLDLGYRDVRALDGGLAAWTAAGRPLCQGLNVPSKVFGEAVLHQRRTPEVTPGDLSAWMAEGRDLLIVDARTPEEYRRGCVPGAVSVPGAELALRMPDLLGGPATTVVVHCGGRTRSYLGAESLRRAGLPNPVVALQNGTMGWELAGLALERGAARRAPPPSASAVDRSRALGARLAAEDGLLVVSSAELRDLRERRVDGHPLPLYLFDVRTVEEHAAGHVPGAAWAPGGQLVQATDDYVAIRGATVVLVCDGGVRAVLTAGWLRRMGLPDVRVLAGGAPAWAEAEGPLETGSPVATPAGLAAARASVSSFPPGPLGEGLVLSVDGSDAYSRAHVPGAGWVCRSRLELRLPDLSPDRGRRIVLTCQDGSESALGAAALRRAGYRDVQVLEGGLRAWCRAGQPVASGPERLLDEPDDVALKPYDRGPAAMAAYLAWEEALDAEGLSSHSLFPAA